MAATMDGTVRRATVAALLAVVMVACGDGGTGATDATSSEASVTDAPDASPTPQATTGASPTTTPILSADEQACVDAFMTYLEDIEDVVDGFDFEEATLLEYQDVLVKLVPAGQALVDRVKGMRCAVLDGTPSEELAPIIVDIAGPGHPARSPISTVDRLVRVPGQRVHQGHGDDAAVHRCFAARSAISPWRSDTTCSVWSRRSARPAAHDGRTIPEQQRDRAVPRDQ
jgi:hypothetical protein